ncbi:hypothetical protein [Halocalculus aciditolerans]|uniref:Uncharacterized protein n=1 Tax=Halocalculus aciditolerans TaxID=1383812 RepID=A0A830F3S9_9EURY|nr:hypothetical protein [Halocalculus aciditolerans]GGL52293.1 hypothetical protein GCM10009039_08220 [Halocalculus aciditolerans]
MPSRRTVLTGATTSALLLSGCTSIVRVQPKIDRGIEFRRGAVFYPEQPDLQAEKPLARAYIFDTESEASALNWGMLLHPAEYRQTNFDTHCLVLVVGLSESGTKVVLDEQEVNGQSLSYQMSVTAAEHEPERPTFSYYLQKWRLGTVSDIESTDVRLSGKSS